jgi:hypothetical protein
MASKKYIATKKAGEYKEVVGYPVNLEGFEDYSFFTHKTESGWSLIEASTGRALLINQKTQKKAIKNGIELLSRVDNRSYIATTIGYAIALYGRSPNKIKRRKRVYMPGISYKRQGSPALTRRGIYLKSTNDQGSVFYHQDAPIVNTLGAVDESMLCGAKAIL